MAHTRLEIISVAYPTKDRVPAEVTALSEGIHAISERLIGTYLSGKEGVYTSHGHFVFGTPEALVCVARGAADSLSTEISALMDDKGVRLADRTNPRRSPRQPESGQQALTLFDVNNSRAFFNDSRGYTDRRSLDHRSLFRMTADIDLKTVTDIEGQQYPEIVRLETPLVDQRAPQKGTQDLTELPASAIESINIGLAMLDALAKAHYQPQTA